MEIIIKKDKLTEFLLPLNPSFENNEKRLKENLRTFQSNIKKCDQLLPRKPYEWQPSEVCISGRNCLTLGKSLKAKARDEQTVHVPKIYRTFAVARKTTAQ